MATSSTACVIVGGGPAGALLALLLAQRGVEVVVLERATDFDRAFRGNTLNPGSLALLDDLDLLAAIRAQPHARTTHFTAVTPDGPVRFADFAEIGARHPYVLLTPQAHVLPVVLDAAVATGRVRIELGAEVVEVIEDDGTVAGVRYTQHDQTHTLRAALVVACDGRASTVRRLADLTPVPRHAAIDVLWLHLPRHATDPDDAGAYFHFGPGSLVALQDAFTAWQVGVVIQHDTWSHIQAQGLCAFRDRLAATIPAFADRVDTLADWRQVAPLRVTVDRLPRWHRPGLLCLGDAAHAMSPLGMVGINVAIQDAVVAADLLADDLRRGVVSDERLAAVQRRRQGAVALVQHVQVAIHAHILRRALATPTPYRFSTLERALMTNPLLRRHASRLIAFGRL